MIDRRNAFDIALVLGAAPFLAACLFAHPTADDFIYASNARAGLWTAWINEYLHWNGRYTSNAVVLASPLAFGVRGYRAAVAAGMAGIACSMYALVRVWAADALDRRTAVTCALAVTLLFAAGMPSPGEGIFWYTSAATYSWSIVPALLHAALIIRYTRKAPPSAFDHLSLLVAAVLLTAVAGFNEVIMLMAIVIYGVWAAVGFLDRSPTRMLALVFMVVAVVSGLFVLLSPGNAVRQSIYSDVRHQFWRSVAMTLLQMLRFNGSWISNAALLTGSLLFVPVAEARSRSTAVGPRAARHTLSALILSLAVLVPVATFPAYWETGTLGQHRTVNVAFFAFLIIWFAAIPSWLTAFDSRARPLRAWVEAWRPVLAVLFLIALGLTGNTYRVASELLVGKLQRYDTAMRDRYARLADCRSRATPTCDLPRLEDVPASFTVADVVPAPSDWVNVAYARYFGVPAVRAVADRGAEHVRY